MSAYPLSDRLLVAVVGCGCVLCSLVRRGDAELRYVVVVFAGDVAEQLRAAMKRDARKEISLSPRGRLRTMHGSRRTIPKDISGDPLPSIAYLVTCTV